MALVRSDPFGEVLEIGCDLGQGYYWSPPLPADDMEALLELRAERAG